MTHDSFNHHRRSIRLKEYDYSQAGAYFVTICAEHRECLFGDIVGGEMRLNAIGHATMECWGALPQHFPHAELDEFVVMPNHVHGILVIVDDGRGTACRAPTTEQFGNPISGSLATIVRSFKSAVTKRINEMRDTQGANAWQRNYYEHIIRNERELERIRTYIVGNPAMWDKDENNPAAMRRSNG
jgi:putative transposase